MPAAKGIFRLRVREGQMQLEQMVYGRTCQKGTLEGGGTAAPLLAASFPTAAAVSFAACEDTCFDAALLCCGMAPSARFVLAQKRQYPPVF